MNGRERDAGMERAIKRLLPLLAAMAALSASAAERIGDWWVAMPADVLRSMSASERTCADRALGQLDGNGAKAAADEFKRFETEFLATATEDALAWASFFRAYSLDRANDKFKAVDQYSETIELYPDSPATCAALFFRGRCQGANGQVQKGLDDYRELVGRPEFASHPLAYAAHNRLASGELKAGRLASARTEWEAVRALPRDGNRTEWDDANGNLSLLAALADPEAAMRNAAGDETVDAGKRREKLRGWRNWIWGAVWNNTPVVEAYFRENLGGAKDVRAAELAWLGRMSATFAAFAEPIYRGTPGGDWELATVELDAAAALDPKNLSPKVDRMVALLRKTDDPEVRSSRAVEFAAKLRDMGRIDEAKLLLDCIADPVRRARTAAGIGWRARDGAYVAEALAPLEALPDPEVAGKAKREHARCCQELLKDYDAAIRLYEEAPSPPATLWEVARCHRAAGRLAKAQAALDEICGVFPADAAQAMLAKGDWYRDAGDRKNAIACYRRILAHAEWKKGDAASQAHQRLEAFGIATGGAVVNEAH